MSKDATTLYNIEVCSRCQGKTLEDLISPSQELDATGNSYHAMELATFVPLRLALVLRFSSTKLSKVLGGFGYNILEQLHLDPTKLLA
jgi:hypothetical protein